MFSRVKSKTSSNAPVFGRIPRRRSLPRSCFSSFSLPPVDVLKSDLAIARNFETMDLWRHSSLLFRNPYWPSILSSSSKMSIRQGFLAVSYFFRCFFGSPISASSLGSSSRPEPLLFFLLFLFVVLALLIRASGESLSMTLFFSFGRCLI